MDASHRPWWRRCWRTAALTCTTCWCKSCSCAQQVRTDVPRPWPVACSCAPRPATQRALLQSGHERTLWTRRQSHPDRSCAPRFARHETIERLGLPTSLRQIPHPAKGAATTGATVKHLRPLRPLGTFPSGRPRGLDVALSLLALSARPPVDLLHLHAAGGAASACARRSPGARPEGPQCQRTPIPAWSVQLWGWSDQAGGLAVALPKPNTHTETTEGGGGLRHATGATSAGRPISPERPPSPERPTYPPTSRHAPLARHVHTTDTRPAEALATVILDADQGHRASAFSRISFVVLRNKAAWSGAFGGETSVPG
eukprot:364050-Chlamydomonas_euryale.AAC.26